MWEASLTPIRNCNFSSRSGTPATHSNSNHRRGRFRCGSHRLLFAAVLAIGFYLLHERCKCQRHASARLETASATSATSSRRTCSTTTTPSPARTTARPPRCTSAPRPVPPYVGHTWVTYQPFMPHEFLYKHSRSYYTYNRGAGWRRTNVRYGTCGLRHQDWCDQDALPDEQQHLGPAQRLPLSRPAVLIESQPPRGYPVESLDPEKST